MEKKEIPEGERRVKRLFVPITPTEHNIIMQYCKKRKVKLTDLVRYALKQNIDF